MACTEGEEEYAGEVFLGGNVQEGDHLEDLNVEERIISKWKHDVRVYRIDVVEGVDK